MVRQNFNSWIFRLLSVIAISLFVFLAGCTTSSGGSSSAAGLEITKYEISPQTIYEDESIDVDIIVENRGSKTMLADSRLWIYGPSHNEWMASGEMVDAFSTSGLTIRSEDMLPGDYDEIYGSFNYIGDVAQGTHKEYEFVARVCYPYMTSYVGNFYAISRDEARLEKQTGKKYDVLSSGPIGISFVKSNRVLTGNAVRGSVNIEGNARVGGVTLVIQGEYRSGEGQSVRFVSLPIEISNRGDGFPTLPTGCDLGPDVDASEKGYVAVRVLLNGEDITSSCFDTPDTREVRVTYSDGRTTTGLFGIVKLRREGGKYTTGRITCRIEGLDFDTPEKQYNLDVEAYYDYYITRKQTVTVKSVEDIY